MFFLGKNTIYSIISRTKAIFFHFFYGPYYSINNLYMIIWSFIFKRGLIRSYETYGITRVGVNAPRAPSLRHQG